MHLHVYNSMNFLWQPVFLQPTLVVSAGQTINYSFLFLVLTVCPPLLKPEAPPILFVQSTHSACESRQECRSWPHTGRWSSLHSTPLHFSSLASSTLVCGLWRHAGEYAAQGKLVMISRLPCAPWIRNTTRYFSNPLKPNGKTVTKQIFFLHYYRKKKTFIYYSLSKFTYVVGLNCDRIFLFSYFLIIAKKWMVALQRSAFKK